MLRVAHDSRVCVWQVDEIAGRRISPARSVSVEKSKQHQSFYLSGAFGSNDRNKSASSTSGEPVGRAQVSKKKGDISSRRATAVKIQSIDRSRARSLQVSHELLLSVGRPGNASGWPTEVVGANICVCAQSASVLNLCVWMLKEMTMQSRLPCQVHMCIT